ncbi:MAG TPA: glycerol-3-phosphate dehydrogenase/oxidase [Puia sp.]|nr:glycerol-3-phosphate dehydrogenase/oxidase [Puia sp.]
MIRQLAAHTGDWDICIIGGGATGLGAAVDAASRGFKTLLLEQFDFAKGTSSRSTKLVHGGVRYLQQGNIKLVMEALHERGLLKKNAPHLVKNQSFIVPNYKWWEGPYYGIGLKVYDWMAGRLGLGASQLLSAEETLALAPTLEAEGLRGSVLYYDGQFDDARLAINLATTATEQGCTLLNYCRVYGLQKNDGRISGLMIHDELEDKTYAVNSRAVINATGIFTDNILKMDDPASEPIIAPSQGVHIVLDKDFLPGDAAIMVPHTDDGRVLFAVPWHHKVIIGTTDTAIDQPTIEPRALPEEIAFILLQIGRYLTKVPTDKDIRSIFAGLRPLVKSSGKKTAEMARDHLIMVSDSGLVTITGGKWTTYRRMAEDVINTVIKKTRLENKPCVTSELRIHGALDDTNFNEPLYYHGTDIKPIREMIRRNPASGDKIHARLPYLRAEIQWAVRQEMCMTVEDALSRRTRSLLLDAAAAMEAAPVVADIIAVELNKDDAWKTAQVNYFREIAGNYLPPAGK